jgi:putative ABC transport system permease protein
MRTILKEICYSWRVLRRKPGFIAATILCLALGIGGVTAVLSVFNGMFVKLLSYKDADRLVVFETRVPGIDRPITSTASAFYQNWRDETDCFTDLGAYYWHTSHDPFEGWKDTEDRLKDLKGFHITPNFFSVLGVKPILGRTFDRMENDFREHHLVIISHHAWRDRFRTDPNVLTQTVRLEGHHCRIIGVMPPNIRFLPSTAASLLGTFSSNNSVDYWIPMPEKFHKLTEIDCSFDVIGRLKKDVTLAAARSQIDVLTKRQFEQFLAPMGIKSMTVTVVPLREHLLGNIHAGLWLLLAAAGFVLMIACANVANLLLIHNLNRMREMAVCSALGGTRWQWLRQRITDSMLIALSGGLLGILLALWAVRLLVAVAPADLPGLDQIRLDPAVLGFTLLISAICGLVVGILPSLRITRSNLTGLLKGISWSSSTVGVKERRTLGSLGMTEVTLALVLFLGATLTLRSFWRVMQVELGVDTDNILCARVMGPDLMQNHQALLDGLQGLPGIGAVSTVTALPLTDEESDFTTARPVIWDDARKESLPQVSLRTVSPDYFRVMGIRLLQGRSFDTRDSRESDRVVIINQSLARHLWPDVNPIEQHIRFDDIQMVMGNSVSDEEKQISRRIVGIIQDVKYKGPDAEAPMEVYLPFAQAIRKHTVTSLALRCQSTSIVYTEVIKRQVEGACPGCSVTGFSTMHDFLSHRTSVRRFVMILLLTFAGIALSLAVVGIYSVTAYTVSARMREVGIRMAFGADQIDILRIIVKQGMVWVLAGLGFGLLLALMLRQAITSQLFGISAIDPVTIVVGILAILLVSLTACMLPARRAAKVDPMKVLRYE